MITNKHLSTEQQPMYLVYVLQDFSRSHTRAFHTNKVMLLLLATNQYKLRALG